VTKTGRERRAGLSRLFIHELAAFGFYATLFQFCDLQPFRHTELTHEYDFYGDKNGTKQKARGYRLKAGHEKGAGGLR
jgi:hypothetical protein